jgi:hypothetical protein
MTEDGAKLSPEYERFRRLLERLLTVQHSAIVQRLQEYRERSLANPRRRGPKRKASS